MSNNAGNGKSMEEWYTVPDLEFSNFYVQNVLEYFRFVPDIKMILDIKVTIGKIFSITSRNFFEIRSEFPGFCIRLKK